MTNTQLRASYWLVTNKEALKKYLAAVLIVFNVILWGFSIYKWIYYIEGTTRFSLAMAEMKKDLINWKVVHLNNIPMPLEIINFSFIPLGKSKYDFVAEINNSNDNWLASNLDYRFSWFQGTKEQSSFILPQEKKFLLALNVESNIAPNDLSFEFLKINWNRITPKMEMINFKTSDIVVGNILSEPSLKRVSFLARNNSAYSFWKAYFNVIIRQDGKIAAVNKIPIDQFLSGEERLIESPFSNIISQSAQIIVEPEINVLDANNIISPKNNIGELK